MRPFAEDRFVEHEATIASLVEAGVPPELASQTIAFVPTSTLGLLLFGSYARGDYIADSDVDLLALVGRMYEGISFGQVSVSCYTAEQLRTAQGTLFGAHLARDGKILYDPTGQLQELLSAIGDVDTDHLLDRIRHLSQVLDASDADLQRSLPGLVREARYLLRSALYGLAISQGDPCFSVREIAARNHDDELVRLLSSRESDKASQDDYHNLVHRLTQLLGALPKNPHGSLDALIVNSWENDPDLASVGVLARGRTGGDPYEEFEKVLL